MNENATKIGPAMATRELLGLPNRITLARTVVAMAFAVVAYRVGTPIWLFIAYPVYWLGDSLDGGVARYRKQETISGAVFDVVCDRACAFFLAGAFLAVYPDVLGPLALFLFQFGVLDTMLTLSFLLWPGCISPNYFFRIDKPIYKYNWSMPAKALNTGGVVVSLVLGHNFGVMWLAYLTAGALALLKIVSLTRLLRILTGRTAAQPSA
ncbi:CDP-alcohol phosphatidyltransferase family protein [Kribbella sp. NPDC058245]|uniref:CDP-alcohol phosphatidyltransferase family protein n=1 Tax=Kribbella sp. NPDC058245 TaxID=3346399 RepID=UPI0036EC5819